MACTPGVANRRYIWVRCEGSYGKSRSTHHDSKADSHGCIELGGDLDRHVGAGGVQVGLQVFLQQPADEFVQVPYHDGAALFAAQPTVDRPASLRVREDGRSRARRIVRRHLR